MIALCIAGYVIVGTVLAVWTYLRVVANSIDTQLAELEDKTVIYPRSYRQLKDADEKKRLEYAIKQANEYDAGERGILSILTLFFWPCVTPVFSIYCAFRWLTSKNITVLSGKHQKRLAALQEIEQLKAKALEDEAKFQAAVMLLKSEGIKL